MGRPELKSKNLARTVLQECTLRYGGRACHQGKTQTQWSGDPANESPGISINGTLADGPVTISYVDPPNASAEPDAGGSEA